jgi:hypothetical protein
LQYGITSEYVELSEQIKYKYLISLDGLTADWQRVPWILLSGSVLLLVDSDIEQWFSRDIEPWVHYVPIKRDFSDLIK